MKANKNLCLVIGLLMLSLTMGGCSKQMNMNTVLDEPHFAGVVTEVYENSILVKVNENEEVRSSGDLMDVSLDVEIKDSLSDYNIGDEVCVYYDGLIAETYPGQVRTVYAITIIKEAGKVHDTGTMQLTPFEMTDDLPGVSISIADGSLAPSGLVVVVHNDSDAEVTFGEHFFIEQSVDNEWYQYDPILNEGEYAFNDVGYDVQPGETLDIETNWTWLYGELETGEYRIVKDGFGPDKELHYFTASFGFAEANESTSGYGSMPITQYEVTDDLPSVSLSIADASVTNNGLVVLLQNDSESEVTFGSYFCIEKLVNSEWYQLPYLDSDTEYGWGLAYEVPPGDVHELEINWSWFYGELGTGSYRIVKEGFGPDQEVHYFTATFDIS